MNELTNTNENKLSKKPFFSIRIPAVTVSLNALFGMTHWQRIAEKKRMQNAFMSALLSLGKDSSILITTPQNTQLTVSDMLKYFQTTVNITSLSKHAKKKPKNKKKL